jgi:hypothetical protein
VVGGLASSARNGCAMAADRLTCHTLESQACGMWAGNPHHCRRLRWPSDVEELQRVG